MANITEERIAISKRCVGIYLRWYYLGWHYWLWYQGKIGFVTEGEKYRTLGKQTITLGSGQVTKEQVRAIRTIMNTREIYILTDNGWGAVRVLPGSIEVKNNMSGGYDIEITIIIGSRHISRTGLSPVESVPVVPPTYEYCELACIGEQIWMCLNYDVNYPGSKVYNNDEANRAEYGGLYTWAQVMASGFCPPGWHVPTLAEWQTLITEAGGALLAGDELKEAGTDHWDAPSPGAIDTYGFSMRSTGAYGYQLSFGVTFHDLMEVGIVWCQDGFIRFDHDLASVSVNNFIPPNYFYSVRLLKDMPCETPPEIKYGLLYNWWVTINDWYICAEGWHVPTETDWATLYNNVTGSTEADKANSICIPDALYWDNITGVTNIDAFNQKGNGYRRIDGVFESLKGTAWLWSSTEVSGTEGRIIYIAAGTQFFVSGFISKKVGAGLRLVKDSTTLSHGETGTYTGNDGKVYRTICIGTQEWLADNLCETKYRMFSADIPEVTDNGEWAALISGALCAYDNDWDNV